MAKAKKAKKQAAKKKDTDIEELLDLLKRRPHLVRELVLDPAKVRSLLKSKAARQLIPDTPKPKLFIEAEGYEKTNPPPGYYNLSCLKRSA